MVAKSRRIGLAAEPNLTPILDMVFQLITFFMLVVSFKAASMDPGIRLPVLGSARPSWQETDQKFVVLNIDKSGELRVYGQVCDLEQYLATEVNAIRKPSRPRRRASGNEPLSAAAVIRADKATPFTKLSGVLAACKKHGFSNVTLKVLDAEAQPEARNLPL